MVDTARILVNAGNGGKGSVHFRREKFIPRGGPDGGDGARGGSVYIEVDKNLSTLEKFAYKQKFEAPNGEAGGGRKCSGKAGDDLTIYVPLGTQIVWNDELEGERFLDLDTGDVRVLIARGGKGGKGNWRFRSSVNTTPMEAQPGEPGQSKWLNLELKLLADVGLIGFPNVGKSTLLSVLTAAHPKIADYEFTTLEPNLGVLSFKEDDLGKGVVIADIPGLIEGASEGKGLGDQFLRHIERTRVLVHVLAARDMSLLNDYEEMVKSLLSDYRTIRKELKSYKEALVGKREIVVFNKIDLLPRGWTEKIIEELARKKIKVMPISCGNLTGIPELKMEILKEAGKK